SLPDDITAEATSASGAVVTFSATASDVNPLNPVVTCAPASGATFPLGTTTVSCSATDAAGNTATGSFTVTVVDTTPPAITPPDNITMEAAGPDGAVVTYSGESAYDLVDGDRPVSCAPASGSTFALGETTVTCTASDTRGNTGTASFTVKVQDTTAPILALPADITEEATSASGAVVTFSASASDLVDGDVAVACTPESDSTFALGETTVTCFATDSNGNTASGSFKVTVVDTTPPDLTLPDSFSVEATGPSGAEATYSVSASDLVDGSVAVSCTPASGSVFALGANTVSCAATDAAGNTANGSFTITVVDTTPPTLTLPADQQLEATGPGGAQAFFEASAYDLVDGALTVSCSANSGDTFPLGTTTVTCSVSDAAGNSAVGSFIIIVEDTTAPVITFVSRTPANANGWNNTDVVVEWSCSDIVGVVSASVSETVSTEGANQSATGTCKDTSGNTASDTQTGISIDKTKPSASASRTPAANAFGWNNVDVTVSFSGTDGLSGIDFCSADQVFGEGAGQTASGTCTDKAGNVSDAAVVENINVDKTAPTISGAPDRAPNANGWYNADVTVSFTCNDALSGVDACTAPVTLGEGAAQSVLGSVTDKAGNSASATVSGINIDKTAPVISAALDKLPAATGWFNISTGAPTVNFTCNDALSGLDGACPSAYTFGDGADQAYSKTIYDKAGNYASAGVSDVDVDTVAPSISAAVSPARPASGWWNIASGAPTVTYTCADATSGVASCTDAYTFPEGEDQAHSGTAVDNAGNSATASVSDIDVDLTAPSLTWNGGPADGVSYFFGFVPAEPTCTAADELSGSHGCAVTGYGTTVGAHTMTATALDNAGNITSEFRTYTVAAWTLYGFYQPVDMPTPTKLVYNTVKGGSTVPLKFEIFAGATELTDVAYVKSLTYAQTACDATATSDEIETLATGGTTLRYDFTAGQFIFNWKTPTGAGKCYRVTMTTLDGSSLVAYFKTK
ncbi:MAG: HYR domain-containing protein, partial [Anaerolineales bacterium]